jgi:hypothetical protein
VASGQEVSSTEHLMPVGVDVGGFCYCCTHCTTCEMVAPPPSTTS